MTDAISESRIERLVPDRFRYDETPKFCLLQLAGYEPDEPYTQECIDALLDDCTTVESGTRIERECTLGGCPVTVIEDTEKGRNITGECKGAGYCLKAAFEAVGEAPTTDQGRELYGEIIDTCERAVDKYNAGNFCPKPNCGLSAGVSIDVVPGTAGQCLAESGVTQLPLTAAEQ